jgi:hypothetical protein
MQFLRKMWPILLVFPVFNVCRIPFPPTPPPWLCTVLLNFSNDRPKLSSPPFYSTTFQNFPRIAVLRPEVSKFQHHTKVCSTCRIRCFTLCVINHFLIVQLTQSQILKLLPGQNLSVYFVTYLLIYLLTYSLTPWCRVLLENLTGL